MGRTFAVGSLVCSLFVSFAFGCGRELAPVTKADPTAALRIAWSVAPGTDAGFDNRATSLTAEAVDSRDGSLLSSVTLNEAQVRGREPVVLTGLSATETGDISLVAKTRAEQVVFRQETQVTALGVGESELALVLNGLPIVLVNAVRGNAADIVVDFDLIDPENDPCSVLVEYSGGRTNGPFFGAAAASPDDSTTIDVGRDLTLVWHSSSDEPEATGTYGLRLTPADSHSGFAGESERFAIDNTEPPTPVLLIDGGAPSTNSSSVLLSLVGRGIRQVSLSEDPSFAPAATTLVDNPGDAELPFTLSVGDGQKTLYFSATSPLWTTPRGGSASIEIDTVPPTGVGVELIGGAATSTGLLATTDPTALFAISTGNDPIAQVIYDFEITLEGLPSPIQVPFAPNLPVELVSDDRPAALIDLYFHFIDLAGNSTVTPTAVQVLFDQIAPTTPSTLVATPGAGVGEIVLTWNPGPTPSLAVTPPAEALVVNHYRVQVSPNPLFSQTPVDLTVAVTSHDEPLLDGTWYWRVRAEDTAGNVSPWALAAAPFVIDIEPPVTPTLLTADNEQFSAAELGGAVLAYSDESSSGAVRYEIQTATDLAFTTGATVTSRTSTSMPLSAFGEATWFWRVRAIDAADNASDYSSTRLFTVDLTLPGAPTLTLQPATVVGAALGSVTFAWNPTVGADAFDVELSTSSSFLSVESRETILVTDFSWPMPLLLADRQFYFHVRGRDSAGNVSSWSSSAAFVVDVTPPAAPVLNATGDYVGDDTPTLGWSGVPGAAGYRLQIADASDFATVLVEIDAGTTTQHTVGTALGDTLTYYWRVEARDSVDNGAWSSPGVFTVDLVDPDAPTVSTLTSPTNESVVLFSWAASTGADDYLVQLATSSAFQPATLVVNEATTDTNFSWVTFAGTFYLRVIARDAAGNQSSPSATVPLVIDKTAPQPPLLSAFSPNITNDPTPTLQWLVFDTVGLSEYRIQVSTDPTFVSTTVDTIIPAHIGATLVDDWTVSPDLPASGFTGNTYYARVASRDNATNEGLFSIPQSFVFDDQAPAPPTACTVLDDRCFLSGCPYVNRWDLNLEWPDESIISPVGGYDLDVVDTTNLTVVVNVPVSGEKILAGDVHYTLGGVDEPSGDYELRLFTTDEAGNRSTTYRICAPSAGGGALHVDREAPQALTLRGSYVRRLQQFLDTSVTPPTSWVEPDLFFEPAGGFSSGAPLHGYLFTVSDLNGGAVRACGISTASGAAQAGLACDDLTAIPRTAAATCGNDPEDAGQTVCTLAAAVRLDGDNDLFYRWAAFAVDQAGNVSPTPTFSPGPGIAADLILADSEGPDDRGPTTVLPVSPVTCRDEWGSGDEPTRVGPDGSGAPVAELTWTNPNAAVRFRVDAQVDLVLYPDGPNAGTDTGCLTFGNCRGDLVCRTWANGEFACRVCRGNNDETSCPAQGSEQTVSSRSHPLGAAQADLFYRLFAGWTCDLTNLPSWGEPRPCTFAGIFTGEPSLSLATPHSEDATVTYSIAALDTAGNRSSGTAPTASCTGGQRRPLFVMDNHPSTGLNELLPVGEMPDETVTDDSTPPLCVRVNTATTTPGETWAFHFEVNAYSGGGATPGSVIYSAVEHTDPTSPDFNDRFDCNNPDHPCPNCGGQRVVYHEVATPLPSGFYQWRVRLEDDVGNSTAFHSCFDTFNSPGELIPPPLDYTDCEWGAWMNNADRGNFEIQGGQPGGNAPTPTYPLTGATVCGAPILAWSAQPGINQYEVEVRRTSDAAGVLSTYTTSTRNIDISVGTPAWASGTSYWWRVRGLPVSQPPTLWSPLQTFVTNFAAPSPCGPPVEPLWPLTGSSVCEYGEFTWVDLRQNVPGATRFQLELRNATTLAMVTTATVYEPRFTVSPMGGWLHNTWYEYRVMAEDDTPNSWSTWSAWVPFYADFISGDCGP